MSELYFKFWFFSKFILFSVVGMTMFNQGYSSYNTLKSAEYWELVEGTIKSKEFDERIDENGRPHVTPKLSYQYEYNDNTFSNDVIKMGIGKDMYSFQAEEFVQEYEVGKPAKIYVNPKDPKESTLKLGDPSDETPLMIGGLLFILIAYLLNRKTINHIVKKLFSKNYSRKNDPWFVAK